MNILSEPESSVAAAVSVSAEVSTVVSAAVSAATAVVSVASTSATMPSVNTDKTIMTSIISAKNFFAAKNLSIFLTFPFKESA